MCPWGADRASRASRGDTMRVPSVANPACGRGPREGPLARLGSMYLHTHLREAFGNLPRYGYLGCVNGKARPFHPPLCYFSMTPLQGQGSLHNMDLGILGATLAVGPAAPRGDWPSPAVAGPGLQDGPAMWGLQKGRQLSLSHPVSFPASPPGLGSADGARMEQEAIGVLVQSERQRARRGAIPHRQQRTQP